MLSLLNVSVFNCYFNSQPQQWYQNIYAKNYDFAPYSTSSTCTFERGWGSPCGSASKTCPPFPRQRCFKPPDGHQLSSNSATLLSKILFDLLSISNANEFSRLSPGYFMLTPLLRPAPKFILEHRNLFQNYKDRTIFMVGFTIRTGILF